MSDEPKPASRLGRAFFQAVSVLLLAAVTSAREPTPQQKARNDQIRQRHEYIEARAKLARTLKELRDRWPGVESPTWQVPVEDLKRFDGETNDEFRQRREAHVKTAAVAKWYREAQAILKQAPRQPPKK